MIKKINLDINGMHCSSCALNIDFDLEDQEGIIKSSTNYARQYSEIEYDSEKINIDKIIQTINQTGYKASIKR